MSAVSESKKALNSNSCILVKHLWFFLVDGIKSKTAQKRNQSTPICHFMLFIYAATQLIVKVILIKNNF